MQMHTHLDCYSKKKSNKKLHSTPNPYRLGSRKGISQKERDRDPWNFPILPSVIWFDGWNLISKHALSWRLKQSTWWRVDNDWRDMWWLNYRMNPCRMARLCETMPNNIVGCDLIDMMKFPTRNLRQILSLRISLLVYSFSSVCFILRMMLTKFLSFHSVRNILSISSVRGESFSARELEWIPAARNYCSYQF